MQLIIGLTGRKHHGKSYFCKFLHEKLMENGYHVLQINFADPLFEIARSIGWNGKKDERGRRLLQLLATDVVRECIDEEYWIKFWSRRIAAIDDKVQFKKLNIILCDDVRFDNEATVIKSQQSIIVKVTTPDQDGEVDNHPSEAGINPMFIDVNYNLKFGLEYIKEAVEEFYGTHLLSSGRI